MFNLFTQDKKTEYDFSKKITIKKADLNDLELVVELFDQYRMYYNKASDKIAVTKFLKERIENNDSLIFFAYYDKDEKKIPVGFAQIFPSYSSVSMQILWTLKDLFVIESYRRKRVGTTLINIIEKYCKQNGAKGIILTTERTNTSAKIVYEKNAFLKNNYFEYYYKILDDTEEKNDN